MPLITINDVRTAVFQKLKERFPDIKRYGEELKQGFEESCFFIKLIDASHTQELNTRYSRTHLFDIHYFPQNGENTDAHDMAEQLYDALETIEYNGIQYQGINMRHEIVDQVLHFFVNYNFHVKREVLVDPDMNTLEQQGGLK